MCGQSSPCFRSESVLHSWTCRHLVNVDEVLIFPVGQVIVDGNSGVVTRSGDLGELSVHGVVDDIGRLSIGDSSSSVVLVGEEDDDNLETDAADEKTLTDHKRSKTGKVFRRIDGVEKERTGQLSSRGTEVHETEHGRFLGSSTDVGDGPLAR